jgi:hypothetical protein
MSKEWTSAVKAVWDTFFLYFYGTTNNFKHRAASLLLYSQSTSIVHAAHLRLTKVLQKNSEHNTYYTKSIHLSSYEHKPFCAVSMST